MAYRLHVENATYPIQVIETPREILLKHKPIGGYISFVSPVRLNIGQTCGLTDDSMEYRFLVQACLGFSFSPQFYVSGTIAPQKRDGFKPAGNQGDSVAAV